MTYSPPHSWDLIRKVASADLRRYLMARKWVESPTKSSDLLKFESPSPINEDQEYYEILVPLNDKIKDFYRMIELAIENIAVYYNSEFNRTLSEILYFGDAFQVGVISDETKRGAIPIPKGIVLYERWRDLIAYGICANLSPFTKKFARKNKEANEYVDRSLIGRNTPGSFIAAIYCPLPTSQRYTLSGDLIEPLSRGAVLHIVRGLQYLNRSVVDCSAEPIIQNYSTGLNYNMCSSLVNLIDVSAGGKLNIITSLEPSCPIPKDITETRFLLDPSCKKYLEDAKDALDDDEMEKEVPLSEEQSLEGLVVQLKRDPDDCERTIKLIAMAQGVPDILRVKTVLDEEMYQIAIEAHKAEQKISIKGCLEKGKKFWNLRNPSNLKIIENESRPEKALDKF